MKKALITLGAGIALAVSGLASAQTIIDFDDLVGSGPVPPGYGDIANWGTWRYYDWAQPPYNPNSPPVRIYEQVGFPGRITFGQDLVLEGAWFAGHGTSRGFLPIHFELYLDGQLVHTSGQIDLDSSGTPTWLATGYDGPVDEIVVSGSSGYFVMDDMTFGEPGLSLELSGACPGRITASVGRATPGGNVGVLYAFGEGSFVLPGGPCAGTMLGLNATVRLAGVVVADGAGNGSLDGNVPAAACGRAFVQAIDAMTCLTSGVEGI